MVLFEARKHSTPENPFGIDPLPAAFSPIKFPCTKLPVVAASKKPTPRCVFPELTFPAPGTTPPPVVKINAAGTLAPFEGVDWWISDLQWGDAEANYQGERTLQRMTVEFTEYRPDVQISRTRKHQWPAMVIVKKGWTLVTIAKKYKVPGGWRAIGKIQSKPITDPKKVKVGQHIRMP